MAGEKLQQISDFKNLVEKGLAGKLWRVIVREENFGGKTLAEKTLASQSINERR